MKEEARPDSVGSATRARSTESALNVIQCLMLSGCLLFSAPSSAVAQKTSAQDTLATTVARLDTALFDAYNAGDLKTLDGMIAENLEFFHDGDGLSVGKQAFLRKHPEEHLREGAS